MRRINLSWAIALLAFHSLVLGSFAPRASAYIIISGPTPSLPDHIVSADIVFVGKVVAIDEKPVKAVPFPGAKKKREFKVASVAIQENILGAKDVKTIRVGWIPAPTLKKAHFEVWPPVQQLEIGQEYLFMLPRSVDGDFHRIVGQISGIGQEYADARGPKITSRMPVSPKKGVTFNADVAAARYFVKLLVDPDANLKANDADVRFRTACLLIARYRNDHGQKFASEIDRYLRRKSRDPQDDNCRRVIAQLELEFPQVKRKTESIDATQTKRILIALSGADWTKRDSIIQASPYDYFMRLGVTESDGFKPPDRGGMKVFGEHVKQWSRDAAGSYRIQRFVLENTGK